ncbi:MAG: methyltransferase, partial [Veillonella sp.]|nr:methyltransferase [Veillonella sp.]
MSKHNLKGVEQLLRDTRQSYADLGYVSEPFLYTSPAFLEAHARLLGLTPAPAKT